MFITAKSTSNKTAETKTPAEAQTKVYIFENNSRKNPFMNVRVQTHVFKNWFNLNDGQGRTGRRVICPGRYFRPMYYWLNNSFVLKCDVLG